MRPATLPALLVATLALSSCDGGAGDGPDAGAGDLLIGQDCPDSCIPRCVFEALSTIGTAMPAGHSQLYANLRCYENGIIEGGGCSGSEQQRTFYKDGILAVRRSIVRGVESSPKTYRHRFIPIATDLYDALASVRRPTGYLFSVGDRGISPLSEPRRGLRRALKAAGLRRIGWHVLRHTFASQLVSEGVSVYIVQALLGHTTVQMTTRYAHLAPSAMRGVVEVLAAAELREIAGPRQSGVNNWRTSGEQQPKPRLTSPSVSATASKKVHPGVDPFAGAVGET